MKRYRMNALLCLIGMMPSQLAGQTDRPLNDDQIREIVISPSSVQRPALQYRLFPDRNQMIDRNAAIYYHRATSMLRTIEGEIREQRLLRPDQRVPYLYDHYNDWMDTPLNQLPLDQVQSVLDAYEPALEELERARVSSRCHWGIMPDRTEDVHWIQLQMAEIQHMRSAARVLLVEARMRMAQNDLHGAIRIFQTVFKMAHDLENTGSIIGSLVGIALVGMAQDQLVEFIQLPDAPNLYWPLVDLPQPIVSVRESVRYELGLLSGNSGYRTLDRPAEIALTPEQWQRELVNDLSLVGETLPGYSTDTQENLPVRLLLTGLVMRGYPPAKQALIDRGYASEQVESMPAAQVVAIQQKYVTQAICDDVAKALNLPATQLLEELDRIEDFKETGIMQPPTANTNLLPFIEMMFPAMRQIIQAEMRIQRQMTAVRVIEAIRAHASETGQLPASLAEIDVLAVPPNPATENPYEYRHADGVAELDDFGSLDYSRMRYRIRLRN